MTTMPKNEMKLIYLLIFFAVGCASNPSVNREEVRAV